jgi:hypothetical protein
MRSVEPPWAPPEELERGRRTEAAIQRYLAKPQRKRALHNWHPHTLVCVDCGISKVENDSIPYGYGKECTR